MKTIDLENHFVTQEWVDAMYANPGYPRFEDASDTGARRLYAGADEFEPAGDPLLAKLLDLGEGRLSLMDAAGVDVAVLSLTAPGVEHFAVEVGSRVARNANDAVAAAVAAHPDRLEGLASLAFKDAHGAAAELERAVRELGLKGVKTHSNFGDSFIDDARYRPVLAKAEELGVPIYLHPAAPMIAELRTYGLALAGAAFGFGVETATAMMRLILSGTFDELPKLKIILGHYGETLPFLMQRVDHPFVRPFVKADGAAVPDLERKPSDYLHDNMVVTTSGNYLPAAFKCAREALGMDKIALGTDHPYEDMDECMAFLAGLDLDRAEQAALYEENAAALGFGA